MTAENNSKKFTFIPVAVLDAKIKPNLVFPQDTVSSNLSTQHYSSNTSVYPSKVVSNEGQKDRSSTSPALNNLPFTSGDVVKPKETELSLSEKATSASFIPKSFSAFETEQAGKQMINCSTNQPSSEPDCIILDTDSENDAETASSQKSLSNRDINTVLFSTSPTSSFAQASVAGPKADGFYDLPDGYDFDYDDYVKHLHDCSKQKGQSPRVPSGASTAAPSLSVASLGGKSPLLPPKPSLLNTSMRSPFAVATQLPSYKNPPLALAAPNLSHAYIDFHGAAASAASVSASAAKLSHSTSSPRGRVSSSAVSAVAPARADHFDYSGPENDGDSAELRGEFPFSVDVRRLFRTVFGLKEFRTNQLQAINAALLDYDTFVIMPTGPVSFLFLFLVILQTNFETGLFYYCTMQNTVYNSSLPIA